MDNKVIRFSDYKKNVKETEQAEAAIKDLNRIIPFITLAIKGLEGYARYKAVAEILAVLHTKRTMLNISLKKLETITKK